MLTIFKICCKFPPSLFHISKHIILKSAENNYIVDFKIFQLICCQDIHSEYIRSFEKNVLCRFLNSKNCFPLF